MPDSIAELRQALFYEDVAKRLARGDSLRQIGQKLNIRTGVLHDATCDPEFLTILDRVDSDLADDIRAEREAAEPEDYETRVMGAADKAVEQLEHLAMNAESEQAQVAASKALAELAQRVKKERPTKGTRRTSFPASQLKNLMEAAREVNEMDQRIAKQSSREDAVL